MIAGNVESKLGNVGKVAVMATIQVEKRKRGIFGWIVAILFWGFNALMVAWVASYWGSLGGLHGQSEDQFEQAGAVIGGTIGTGMLFAFWFFGAVILGLMMFFTRGKKVVTTQEIPD